MYSVYIIKSSTDNTYYIGSTNNIERRLQDHNAGKSPYTSKKIPWELVYLESFESKTNALKREKFLKKQRNNTFYVRLIKQYRNKTIKNL
jgi:putative endonuclease